jgi:pilus assembly protein Flp/PilA
MTFALWKIHAEIRNLIRREEGQDLVEYALAVALIALGATVGMQTLAAGINTAFGNLANTFSTTA